MRSKGGRGSAASVTWRAFFCIARLLAALVWVLAPRAYGESDVLGLVGQRLDLMRDVAAHKWINGLRIEDRDRETAVLLNAADVALRHGIEVASTRELFRVQISAAKEIQHYWFERWAIDNAPASAPDLNKVVRPQLLVLGEQILASLATQGCCAAYVGDALNVEGLNAGTRAALLRALASVERYRNRLDQVLRSGVLRIGTTGDYAPFSHRAADDEPFVGVDIDLGRDLGASLEAEARFVPTS